MNQNHKIDMAQLVARATEDAQRIIGSTAGIRKAFVDGRPNSSQESTVAGALKAFEAFASFTPKELA